MTVTNRIVYNALSHNQVSHEAAVNYVRYTIGVYLFHAS